ncbi:MAG TPA: sensor histidine kinase [Acidimicrobiales bacterium]|nr:sensor histidine kinase [Acidimicrobiales bacterium]
MATSRLAPVRWLKQHPFQADMILAGVVGVVSVAAWIATSSSSDVHLSHYRHMNALGVVLLAGQVVPLAWRRRAPMVALVIILTATVGFYAGNLVPFTGNIGGLIALYSCAAHLERRYAIRTLAITAAAVALSVGFSTMHHPFSPADLVSNAVIVAAAWILGDNLRTRRAYTASLEERAARLEREQADNAQRAVNEERARIARELHDVVAHSVSVMVVQAGAARRVLERDPDRASEAMSSIELTGRQALDELRRLLGMLRKYGDPVPELTPQPRLQDLDALVTQIEEAGLPVDLVVAGEPRPLPSGVDLSVFRIVQEALTNSLKHAGPARATVTLTYRPDELILDITDDGRGLAQHLVDDNGAAAGHGLVGMRERVVLYGGELSAGPRPGGGYEVRARLPFVPARV